MSLRTKGAPKPDEFKITKLPSNHVDSCPAGIGDNPLQISVMIVDGSPTSGSLCDGSQLLEEEVDVFSCTHRTCPKCGDAFARYGKLESRKCH